MLTAMPVPTLGDSTAEELAADEVALRDRLDTARRWRERIEQTCRDTLFQLQAVRAAQHQLAVTSASQPGVHHDQ